MNNTFRNFYRSFYMRTGGFIPTAPLNQLVFPGDFFQIRNGEMIVFGNIFRSQLVEPAETKLEYGLNQNPFYLEFSHRLSKPFLGRCTGKSFPCREFGVRKPVPASDTAGSF